MASDGKMARWQDGQEVALAAIAMSWPIAKGSLATSRALHRDCKIGLDLELYMHQYVFRDEE